MCMQTRTQIIEWKYGYDIGSDRDWQRSEHTSELETVLNEAHDAIMTEAMTIDEGIAEMNGQAAEILGSDKYVEPITQRKTDQPDCIFVYFA